MKPTTNIEDSHLVGETSPILEDGLTRQIIDCAMKVHGALGAGFLESVYQKALLFELTRSGLKAEADRLLQVRYEGVIVGDFKADLIVDEKIIVELKAVTSLIVEHEVQLVNYLTATGKETGLLLNFGRYSLEFKRKFRNTKAKSASIPNLV